MAMAATASQAQPHTSVLGSLVQTTFPRLRASGRHCGETINGEKKEEKIFLLTAHVHPSTIFYHLWNQLCDPSEVPAAAVRWSLFPDNYLSPSILCSWESNNPLHLFQAVLTNTSLSIFLKCYVSLSLGDKKVAQLYALLPACEWIKDAQGPITIDFEKKQSDWSLIIMCISYFHSDFWT